MLDNIIAELETEAKQYMVQAADMRKQLTYQPTINERDAHLTGQLDGIVYGLKLAIETLRAHG